jgi:beta-glucanase (GH16 family)
MPSTPSRIAFLLLSLAAGMAISQAHAVEGEGASVRDDPLASLSLTANRVFADDFERVPVAAPDGRDDQGAVARWRTSLWFGSGYHRQGGGQGYYADDAKHQPWCASTVAYAPFSVADGILSITARRQQEPIPGFPDLHYLSGILTTCDSFWIDYGYAEIRLKCPAAAGCWTAFFMYPADDYLNRPQASYTKWEMDFLEILGSGIDQLHVTTHVQADALAKNIGDESVIATGPNDDAFHVFGFDKRPGMVEVWRDGVHLLSKPTPARMSSAGYLCLVLDVGRDGGWAGTPDAGRYPQQLLVDYVRVYRTEATTVVGGPAASIQLGEARTERAP